MQTSRADTCVRELWKEVSLIIALMFDCVYLCVSFYGASSSDKANPIFLSF